MFKLNLVAYGQKFIARTSQVLEIINVATSKKEMISILAKQDKLGAEREFFIYKEEMITICKLDYISLYKTKSCPKSS